MRAGGSIPVVHHTTVGCFKEIVDICNWSNDINGFLNTKKIIITNLTFRGLNILTFFPDDCRNDKLAKSSKSEFMVRDTVITPNDKWQPQTYIASHVFLRLCLLAIFV